MDFTLAYGETPLTLLLLRGVVLHQQNSILNFSILVDRSKLKFGQNIKLLMPDHVILHWMHLLYIYKSYSQKNFFPTDYYSGGVFLHQHQKVPIPIEGGVFPPTFQTRISHWFFINLGSLEA